MRTVTACVLFVLSLAVPCAAQSAAPSTRSGQAHRGYVTVNAGSQPTSRSFSDHFTFEQNVETATVDLRYPVKAAILFDGGGGIRLWRQFGVGLSVSRTAHDNAASIEAKSPHAFFFNQPRAVTGTAAALTRTETAAHLQILYMRPQTGHLRLTLGAGPSLINLEQKLVTALHITDEYPYDTASLGSADTGRKRKSAIGFNAGADVTWMFTRHIGAGVLVRFTQAHVKLTTSDSRTIGIDAGGAQAGAGLRFFF